MKKLALLFSIFVLAVSGCGYTTGSVISSMYQTIYIRPLENKIDYMNQDERKVYIPALETKVRSAIADRFMFDGNLRIAEEGNSDLVLKGSLVSFEREELRLNQQDNVKEYRLRVTVALVMWDPVNQKEVWVEPSFAGESTYYTQGPLAKSESAAIEECMTDLARRIVERTVEDW
jgi:hypothetical protein